GSNRPRPHVALRLDPTRSGAPGRMSWALARRRLAVRSRVAGRPTILRRLTVGRLPALGLVLGVAHVCLDQLTRWARSCTVSRARRLVACCLGGESATNAVLRNRNDPKITMSGNTNSRALAPGRIDVPGMTSTRI